MKTRHLGLDGGGTQEQGSEWPRKGASVFACGKKDGVLSRCSVERMDSAGTSFFSERKYARGEEVGVQFNVELGRNEFGARMLTGRIKACRDIGSAAGSRLCRAEASWTPGGYAANATL